MNNSLTFLVDCVKESASAQECMEKVKRSLKGHDNIDGYTFEKLFDLCFKLDCVEGICNKTHYHIQGNVSLGRGTHILSLNRYFQVTKIHNSCATGFSDITTEEKATGKRIYLSSKLFKKGKNVDAYDISKIVSRNAFNDARGDELWLAVREKSEFVQKKAYADAELKKRVTKILDLEDLERMFPSLQKKMQTITDYDDILVKEKLLPFFHQQGIITRVMDIHARGSNFALIGAKPRSGKTYICGGLIVALKPRNVLVITPVPSETKGQFIVDLFGAHLDFKEYSIIDLDSKILTRLATSLGNKNIVVVSKQFLHNKVNSSIVKEIEHLRPELTFYDETHEGGCTQISEKIVDGYAKHSFKVLMTATYAKPLHTWGLGDSECVFWSMEDAAKAMDVHNNIAYFQAKFGHRCFDGFSLDDIAKFYQLEPELCMMSTMFQDEYYCDLLRDMPLDDKMGFSMQALFELNAKQTDFINPTAMTSFIKKIGGKGGKAFVDKECMINRINTVMKSKGSCRPQDFYIQLWFLPYGIGRPIDTISKLLKERYISKHPVLEGYEVMIINSHYSDADNKRLKDDINEKAIEARDAGKKGLILLVGNKCALGISLRLCDVVMLFNTLESCDKIMQMLYRCMTEDSKNGKRVGVVVDWNMQRILRTLMYYGDHTTHKDEDIQGRIRYVTEHLVNIDYDQVFVHNNVDHEQLVSKLIEVWKSYTSSSYGNLIRMIANTEIDLTDDEQKMLKGMKGARNTGGDSGIALDEENDQNIQTGLELNIKGQGGEKEESDGGEEKEEKAEKEEAEPDINFSKDILTHIVPFVTFLTMDTNLTDLNEMMAYIGKNDKLLKIFNDQCKVWWG